MSPVHLFCKIFLASLACLCLVWQPQAIASTFADRILAKPAISQPSNPFVIIFLQGGDDSDRYGFVSDGKMTVTQWESVFRHVGYLGVYSAFKPEDDRLWAAHGQDIAVEAAQLLGRPTGGSVMGVPKTAKQIVNLKTAYSQKICERMDYFFDDDERSYGIPGGQGMSRLRIAPNDSDGFLFTPATSDFDTGPKGILASFEISFGVNFDHFVFGGESVIVGNRTDGYGMWGQGWYVAFHNSGGYFGKNYIRFYSDGTNYIESLPFNVQEARRWNTISVMVQATADPGFVQATITIPGVGTSGGRLRRPTFAGGRFIIGDPTGQEHAIDYDDIALNSLRGSVKTAMAKYDFDQLQGMATTAGVAIRRVDDESGRGHDLEYTAQGRKYLSLFPTSGVEPAIFQTAKMALVDWLISARRSAGRRARPRLITNWHLGNRPGRLAAWKSAGFTNGSIDCYLTRRPSAGKANIAEPLEHCAPARPMDDEAVSDWSQAWVGNVHPNRAYLASSDYPTLITMAVLGGNRWFSVFTAMSGGTLGTPDESHREQAIENADALYNMAKAASWFQSTSKDLLHSHVLTDIPISRRLNGALIRARINAQTSELWFAGFLPQFKAGDKSESLVVRLPQQRGTVTNLSTGEVYAVTNGQFELQLGKQARPFYFRPLARA